MLACSAAWRSWVNPKFCVKSILDENRASFIWGGSKATGCRLTNNITPMGADVKGGETVHFTLDIRSRRCYSGIRSAK